MMSSLKRMNQTDDHNLVFKNVSHKKNQMVTQSSHWASYFVLSHTEDEIYRRNILPLMNSNFDNRVAKNRVIAWVD